MECAFGVWDERLVLGLRAAGRFDRIIDLETCFLMSPECLEVLKRVRTWAHDHHLSGYHRGHHEGDLRYLVLREGKNTGQRMAVLLATSSAVTPTKVAPSTVEGQGQPVQVALAPHPGGVQSNVLDPGFLRDDGVESLRPSLEPLLTTCWLGVTDEKSDVAQAKDMRLLWGPGTIQEKLGPITYRISPYSFFQTNTHGTEKLYALLQEWAFSISSSPAVAGGGSMDRAHHNPCSAPSPGSLRDSPPEAGGNDDLMQTGGALIDLYCGSGGITLALAASFDRVIGIDTNKAAIEDAKKNAEANGIENAEFVCEDALEFLKKLPGSKLSVQLSAMVVDPPRAGLHPKALQALLEMNPAKLAYVSCNPESLARDLQSLVPVYRIRSAQPVDLFPHTAHVETLCILEHR